MFLSVLFLQQAKAERIEHQHLSVSIVSLISTPEKYDGLKVRISGALRLEFETDQICLHLEDIENNLMQNCIWLGNVSPKVTEQINDLAVSYNRKYVLLEGVFKAPPPLLDIIPKKIYHSDGTVETKDFIGIPLGRINEIQRIERRR